MAIINVPLSRMHYDGHEHVEIMKQVQALEKAGHTVHLHVSDPSHMYIALKLPRPGIRRRTVLQRLGIFSLTLIGSGLAGTWLVIGALGYF